DRERGIAPREDQRPPHRHRTRRQARAAVHQDDRTDLVASCRQSEVARQRHTVVDREAEWSRRIWREHLGPGRPRRTAHAQQLGPNGSGKTTTVNLLSGVYRVDGGEIRLGGERIDRLRPHEIAGRGVGRTFQVPKLFGNMTVLENILVPAMAALDRGDRRPMPEILDRAGRLLHFVMLAELRDALAKELSGGQAMLAQIARALMIRPLR